MSFSSPRGKSKSNNNNVAAPMSPPLRPPKVVTTTTAANVFGSPTGSVASAGSYAISTTSSAYRHHTSTFLPSTPLESPKTKLYTDSNHNPKTRGSVGLLVVGLGAKSSTALLAGILANRLDLTWKGPKGETRNANYNACLTQQVSQHNKNNMPPIAGFQNHGAIQGLANVSMAAIGGWDITPTKLGDALLDAQLLDYDLVRQVKEEMNKIKVFRGYYYCLAKDDEEQQYTHVLSQKEAPNASEALKCLRADIRYFKWRNGVVGHTTVVWNASSTKEVECSILQELETARDLLNYIEDGQQHLNENDNDEESETTTKPRIPLPPSVLYATAALLEGCSFCNAKDNDTLQCPGLLDLARQQVGVYCLGSNFCSMGKYLQTNMMECLQSALGMETRVTTMQSNENDKQDNDNNRREMVEYTSLGFLGEPHTVVMYTDSTANNNALLYAPLLMDVAVWCDYFSNRSWPYDKVAKALSYLFAIPDGPTTSSIVDPQQQQDEYTSLSQKMQELTSQAVAACHNHKKKPRSAVKKRVRIRPEEKTTEWAIPHDARVVCAGLACVDMQLHQATGGDGGESIETFGGAKSIGGGSVSMACKTLARLCHGAPLDDDYMQVTPPVVHSVIPLCKVGNDDSGIKLVTLLEECGGACRNVETKHIRRAQTQDAQARTALAVLPIYRDGRRGCFFDAASNATFSESDMVELIHGLTPGATGPSLDLSMLSEDDVDLYKERVLDTTPVFGAFLFGYPHLLPKMQGEALANILLEARSVMEEGGIVALDLNGVPEDSLGGKKNSTPLRTVAELKQDTVIGPALQHVDILHMNEDELKLLTGCQIDGSEASNLEDEFAIAAAVNLFLLCGVAIVAVTRGKKGSFVSCNNEDRFKKSPLLPSSWTDCTANIAAVELPRDTVINTNGAGDSFTAGLLVASMLRHTGMSVPVRKDADNDGSDGDKSLELDDLNAKATPPSPKISTPPPSSPKAKLSPYTLYMREHYVNLKQQLNDDKKAIFSKCHEMWENESEDVKAMYERRAVEEEDEGQEQNEASLRLDNDLERLDSTPRTNETIFSTEDGGTTTEAKIRSMYMTNRALNLESAVQFASLVAAHHVDVSTRDLVHLDMSRLLERAMIFPHGLQEI